MAIIRWNPLCDITPWISGDNTSDFLNMQREIDRIFDRLTRGGTVDNGLTFTWLPDVDVVEHDNEYLVNIELPGVNKNDVKITVANDVLTIRGEKKTEKDVSGKNYRRRERSSGSFQRSFTLPSMVKSDQIAAAYDNGILSVTLPKIEEVKPKEIEVKVK